MRALERLARLERALASGAIGVEVVTLPQIRGMSPVEKVETFRECIRGRLVLETGRDRQPRVEFPDPATLSPAERSAIYRAFCHGA